MTDMGEKRTNAQTSSYFLKCPKCLRHFVGNRVLDLYSGRCNQCDTPIDNRGDRV